LYLVLLLAIRSSTMFECRKDQIPRK